QMHRRAATIGSQFGNDGILRLVARESLREFADDMAQPMDLLLARHVAEATAGILDILLAAHDLPKSLRRLSVRLPQIDLEDQAVAPRLVVEHDLDRRIGVDATIPIMLAVDLDGRKCRWQ